MNNDNQAEIQAHLLNSIQRMEQANQLMDQANANLDRTINQARNQATVSSNFPLLLSFHIVHYVRNVLCDNCHINSQ